MVKQSESSAVLGGAADAVLHSGVPGVGRWRRGSRVRIIFRGRERVVRSQRLGGGVQREAVSARTAQERRGRATHALGQMPR